MARQTEPPEWGVGAWVGSPAGHARRASPTGSGPEGLGGSGRSEATDHARQRGGSAIVDVSGSGDAGCRRPC